MDGITPERCEECGFDATRWRRYDAVSLLRGLGLWWRLATDGIPSDALNTRPAPAVWSALEYGVHTALVTAVLRVGIETILASDGVELPAAPRGTDASPDDDVPSLDPAAVLADIEREAAALVEVARRAPTDAWTHTGRLASAGRIQAEAALLHAVHDASHHQMDAGRGLATIGAGTPPHRGTVVRVNASGGGVPKGAIPHGRIDTRGLAGDRQNDAKHHGRPFQALCLWSAEVIDGLRSQGHPIGPGYAGENLTLAGVDWERMRPGVRLRLGTALAEVSFPATPCHKQAGWFTDGDFKRIAHERNPAWTRWYAWVREPGEVAPGDPVVVQP